MKLNPFKLERYFAEHEFSAPYLMCSSDCESLELRELLALEPNAQKQLESLGLDTQYRKAIHSSGKLFPDCMRM
jgi:hypothetical protein